MRVVSLSLFMSLHLLAFYAGVIPVNFVWGIQYFSSTPFLFQITSFVFVIGLSAFLWNRELKLPDKISYRVVIFFLFLSFSLFTLFPSEMLYGDSTYTIRYIEQGERINWKEPLDRYTASSLYQVGNALFDWSARDAIAVVSYLAGIVWVIGVFWLATLYSTVPYGSLLSFAFLLSPGIMQLFFGNIENYSLLAAGTLLTLCAGIRSIRLRDKGYLPTLIFGITFCIHLSTAWLGLAMLYLSFLLIEGQDGAFLKKLFIQWCRMLGYFLVPVVPTFLLAWLYMGGGSDLTFEYIGGGDGIMFKPIFERSSKYEKYLMFEGAHFVALINHFLLIAPLGFILFFTYGHKFITTSLEKSERSEMIFVLMALIGVFIYVFTFNADMSIHNIGLLSEWDLFSLPAIPLLIFVLQLILFTEPDGQWRFRVGFFGAAVSMVLATSWILHNAKIY